ncbi:hypothetical protein D3C76_1846270 [compost metagenome]
MKPGVCDCPNLLKAFTEFIITEAAGQRSHTILHGFLMLTSANAFNEELSHILQ